MATEQETWHKHGPVYDADVGCDVWGISAEPYGEGEEQTMRMWVFSEADADSIIRDRAAARREATESAERWEAYHHPDTGWYVARADIDTDSQTEAQAIYVMIESSAISLRDILNAAARNLATERAKAEALATATAALEKMLNVGPLQLLGYVPMSDIRAALAKLREQEAAK